MDIIIMVILLVLLASLRAFPVALLGFFKPSPPRASRGPYHSYGLARSRLQTSNASSHHWDAEDSPDKRSRARTGAPPDDGEARRR